MLCLLLLLLPGCAGNVQDAELPEYVMADYLAKTVYEDFGQSDALVQRYDFSLEYPGSEVPAFEYVVKSHPDNLYTLHQLNMLDSWQYTAFELFRGAERVNFTSYLGEVDPDYSKQEHSERFLEADYGEAMNPDYELNLEISFPYLEREGEFAESLNLYYKDKLQSTREWEILRMEESGLDNFYCSHRYDSLYAYAWERFYTVVTEHHTMDFRQFCEPIFDNFDTISGKRLALSDVFSVGRAEYEARLTKALRSPIKFSALRPVVSAMRMDEDIPLPKDENFLITPQGLAFSYQIGEIDSVAEGPVFLLIPYESVADILSPVYFEEVVAALR
jgi:hypothetical protein